MSDTQERPLDKDEEREFAAVSATGLRNIGVTDADAPPEAIVKLVDATVDKWQRGGFAPRKSWFGPKPPPPDTVGAALSLGSVWGNQIVRQFGWEWTCVLQDGGEYYGVVSPDRAWVIYPTYFIKACLDNPQADCTAMLSFNMMLGGLPEAPANTYDNLMLRVQRIIPKR